MMSAGLNFWIKARCWRHQMRASSCTWTGARYWMHAVVDCGPKRAKATTTVLYLVDWKATMA